MVTPFGQSAVSQGYGYGPHRVAETSGATPGNSSVSGRPYPDPAKRRLLCVHCLQDDEDRKPFKNYNALRKHQGRIHNVWCSVERKDCGHCGQLFEGDVPEDHRTRECGVPQQRRRWKRQPGPGPEQAQKRADMFATAQPAQIQRVLVLEDDEYYINTSAERQRRWLAVSHVWQQLASQQAQGGTAAVPAATVPANGGPVHGLAPQQQHLRPAGNTGTGQRPLAPVPQTAVTGAGGWADVQAQQQYSQQCGAYAQPTQYAPPIADFAPAGMPQNVWPAPQHFQGQSMGFGDPAGNTPGTSSGVNLGLSLTNAQAPFQYPQAQHMDFQGDVASTMSPFVPDSFGMGQNGNIPARQWDRVFSSVSGDRYQYEAYRQDGGLDFGAAGNMSAQMGPPRRNPRAPDQQGVPTCQERQLSGSYLYAESFENGQQPPVPFRPRSNVQPAARHPAGPASANLAGSRRTYDQAFEEAARQAEYREARPETLRPMLSFARRAETRHSGTLPVPPRLSLAQRYPAGPVAQQHPTAPQPLEMQQGGVDGLAGTTDSFAPGTQQQASQHFGFDNLIDPEALGEDIPSPTPREPAQPQGAADSGAISAANAHEIQKPSSSPLDEFLSEDGNLLLDFWTSNTATRLGGGDHFASTTAPAAIESQQLVTMPFEHNGFDEAEMFGDGWDDFAAQD